MTDEKNKNPKLLPKDDPLLASWTKIVAILEEIGAPKTRKFPRLKVNPENKGDRS